LRHSRSNRSSAPSRTPSRSNMVCPATSGPSRSSAAT
jgi:hypothetical protein